MLNCRGKLVVFAKDFEQFYKDFSNCSKTPESELALLTEKNSRLELELIKAKKVADTFKDKLMRERETSSDLRRNITALDLVLLNASYLRCERENLTSCLHEKYLEICRNVSIMSERVNEVEIELRQAKDEKSQLISQISALEQENTITRIKLHSAEAEKQIAKTNLEREREIRKGQLIIENAFLARLQQEAYDVKCEK